MNKLQPKQKKILAIYLCWIVFNFILLSFGNIDDFNTGLWPFARIGRSYNPISGWCGHGGYDWFDFLVYTLSPIVIYIIAKLFKEGKEDK